jgi:hypothetical protein
MDQIRPKHVGVIFNLVPFKLLKNVDFKLLRERGTSGRPIRRWEDNIKMDLQEVCWGCGDWMELAHDRDRWRAFVNTAMNFQVQKMRGVS